MTWATLPLLAVLAGCGPHPVQRAAMPLSLPLPRPPVFEARPVPAQAAPAETDLFAEAEAARGRAAKSVFSRGSDPGTNDRVSGLLAALQEADDHVRAADRGRPRAAAVVLARRALRELLDFLVAHGG